MDDLLIPFEAVVRMDGTVSKLIVGKTKKP